MENGVYIEGVFVTFDELMADVYAAIDKGLSRRWAFTPETVMALLAYIADNKEC